MDEKTLMNLSDGADEAIKPYDYTPQELEQMLDDKKNKADKFKDDYFAFHNDVKSNTLKNKQDW